MAAEIERKFLVLDDRWRQQASEGFLLQQAYLVATKNRTVRVRIIDARCAKLTVKIRSGQARREEFEYDIPYADAKEMFQYAQGVIEKTRFEVEHQGHTWEVDVYSGQHRGLVIAEVELRDLADSPVLPDWLGPEVTGNSHFSNRVLATTNGNPSDLRVASATDQRPSSAVRSQGRGKQGE
ncbi:CYTH domain-containing protein [Ensifer sp. 2YAB10]|jgi:CYTH domain-containing protein|uniref:CYTH domain-containing protein n=1 Tax=unclassified Ensifer TaxID=2633371 RepID=UPI001A40A0A1|nr:CYTH domain-containing protein [Ensifer sp. SSB1]MBK5571355.1 CYTH domain-containing protein [Ensifer sp. SSB1]